MDDSKILFLNSYEKHLCDIGAALNDTETTRQEWREWCDTDSEFLNEIQEIERESVHAALMKNIIDKQDQKAIDTWFKYKGHLYNLYQKKDISSGGQPIGTTALPDIYVTTQSGTSKALQLAMDLGI
jgi:hypothetical protein